MFNCMTAPPTKITNLSYKKIKKKGKTEMKNQKHTNLVKKSSSKK